MGHKTVLVAEIVNNIRRLFQVVNEQSKKAEIETGLTGPQLWALKVISKETPIMVSDIARRMYLHPATVVGILDRLEAQDLVTRVRSLADRRVVHLELTAKGRAIVENSPEVATGTLVAGLDKLTSNELQSILSGMERIVKILGAQGIPPQLINSPGMNTPSQPEEKTALPERVW